MAYFSSFVGDYFLVFIFFVPFLYFIFKNFNTSKNIPPFPPGPTPWPLLGNIPHMSTKMPHIALSDLSKIHGPLIMLQLGTQKMVVASSATAAKEILKNQDRILSPARYIPKSVPPEVVNNCSIFWLETSTDSWKSIRTLCRTELFSLKTLDSQSCAREKKISDMIEHIAKYEGKAVNIADLVFTTVFNMLSNVLLSSDLIGLNEKNEDGGMKGMIRKMIEEAIAPNIADLYPILSKFDLQGIRRNSRKMGIKIRAFYQHIIDERRNGSTPLNQNDFLDVLLLNKFTDAQIHVLILELLTAGTDTSTATVEWAMTELMKNPESMKKVNEELDRKVGTRHIIKESNIIQLSYLQACVKETLRLHPPGSLLLPRRALETCQVMDYTVPKNAQIYVNVWAIGRDPTIWDEPLMFKPERFLNSTMDFKGSYFEYLPFGGGRRICPGLPMAARHVPLVLASLLHSFDWSMPKGEGSHELDMTEKFGMSLHKEQPLVLVPKQKRK